MQRSKTDGNCLCNRSEGYYEYVRVSLKLLIKFMV
jgi:hypothetical protein